MVSLNTVWARAGWIGSGWEVASFEPRFEDPSLDIAGSPDKSDLRFGFYVKRWVISGFSGPRVAFECFSWYYGVVVWPKWIGPCLQQQICISTRHYWPEYFPGSESQFSLSGYPFLNCDSEEIFVRNPTWVLNSEISGSPHKPRFGINANFRVNVGDFRVGIGVLRSDL